MKVNLARALKPIETGTESVVHEVQKLVSACLDAHAHGVSIIQLPDYYDAARYFIIASGQSDRQVQGIVNRVLKSASDAGIRPQGIEGFEKAHWVLVDFGDTIIHVFYGPVREQYDLEHLWGQGKRVEIPEIPVKSS